MNYHLFYAFLLFAGLALVLGQWYNNNNARWKTADDVPFVSAMLAVGFLTAAIMSIWI